MTCKHVFQKVIIRFIFHINVIISSDIFDLLLLKHNSTFIHWLSMHPKHFLTCNTSPRFVTASWWGWTTWTKAAGTSAGRSWTSWTRSSAGASPASASTPASTCGPGTWRWWGGSAKEISTIPICISFSKIPWSTSFYWGYKIPWITYVSKKNTANHAEILMIRN